ncbi:hypothetical protein [Nocardia wallacei]|uniref:hypothetical protein n=1 Tax=Nocardia wallacei TaxID=480035 RepID=UPI002458F5C1|nr:hypothetical protein [Nocardia wallacei]
MRFGGGLRRADDFRCATVDVEHGWTANPAAVRCRCGREGVLGSKSVGAGGLADDLASRQRAAADDRQQRRRHPLDTLIDFLCEFVDLGGQPAAVRDQTRCESADETVELGQVRRDTVVGTGGAIAVG